MKKKLSINEDSFMQQLNKVIVELNDDFFKSGKTPEYKNKALRFFASIIALLSPTPSQSFKNFDINSFMALLRSSDIKRIAEVGPGSPGYSILFPFGNILQKNTVEAFAIGRDLGGYVGELFNNEGIQVIKENAGNLNGDKLNLDIVIAKNVFSYGGQIGDDEIKIINDSHIGLVNIEYHLSNNPNACVILTEGYDILTLNRNVVSRRFDILYWQAYETDNSFMFRQPEYNLIYKKRARKVFEQSANFVVLKKKSSH